MTGRDPQVQINPEDNKLAKIGYEAIIEFRTKYYNVFQGETPSWEELSTKEMREFTAFATAVRKVLQSTGTGDKTAEHFREAVEIAFVNMSIRSTEETAAWYTLRDWLKAKEGRCGMS